MKINHVLGLLAPLQRSVIATSPDAQTVSNLEYYSQYAAAAYCKQTIGAPVSCGMNACPRVEAANATVLAVYEELPLYQTTGFVAADHASQTIVFTFRGASGLGFLTAAEEYLTPCDSICPGCTCSAGFYASWTAARPVVAPLIAAARARFPRYALATAGHSLGGIQASVAAAELRQNGTAPLALYAYGSPRLGDARAAAHISSQPGNFRVTHTDDPAPRMGDRAAGLRHFSPEYWIARDEPGFEVRPEDVRIVAGIDSLAGNAGTGGFDVLAHVQYFQANIGACFLPVLGQ